MLDEVVAMEVVGGSEREERSHTHYDWAEDFVVDVEIVASTLTGSDSPALGFMGPTKCAVASDEELPKGGG